MSSLLAFLHHLAAFTFVGTLAVEFVLIRGDITPAHARRLLAADALFGAAAGTILVVGLLRVFLYEKGAAYYFHSVPFIVKLCLFAAIGLLSIYPTRLFLSWRKSLREGKAPALESGPLRTVRRIIHWELIALVALILCAALMARGIGYIGT